MRDEGDIGDAPHTNEPRRPSCFAHSVTHGLEHVAVVEIGDRPADRVCERRPDCNDDLARVVARLRDLPFHHDRRIAVVVAEQVRRSDDLRQGLE